MARVNRVAVGDVVYHVINRANSRIQIFNTDNDYREFETLLLEGCELVGMRILAYCIMPNHWHLILFPRCDGDLSEYMRWVTTTHVRQRRTKTNTVGEGHIYQGTFKSFPIEDDYHLTTVIRYVEQNPLRATLVTRAEDWKHSSLYRRQRNAAEDKKFMSDLPTILPDNYLESVNTIFGEHDLEQVRHSVKKGTPYGGTAWIEEAVEKYNLMSTIRGVGRPKNK